MCHRQSCPDLESLEFHRARSRKYSRRYYGITDQRASSASSAPQWRRQRDVIPNPRSPQCRSVVALPPFLAQTPPRTANRPFPGTSEFDWPSSALVGATGPLTGCSMPLECFLTDRSLAPGAPPSSSHLEMALRCFERFCFLFVIWQIRPSSPPR
jgi:hypothetical protein